MYQGRDTVPPDKKNRKIREEIDTNLKRAYSEALNEDVPDRLKELLEQLRQKEEKK